MLPPFVSQNPVAAFPSAAPFADPVATSSAKAAKSVDDALAAHQPTEAQGIASARVKRDASISIYGVPDSLDSILKSSHVCKDLDYVVERIKGMDVREIKIKSYYAFLSERKSHARAVAAYFVSKGLDEGLITAPGDVQANVKRARLGFITIEIVGSLKQNP